MVNSSLRILIATHSPLAAEFGAGQVAINLATALREQGHHVTLWSPHSLPSFTSPKRYIQRIQLVRYHLDEFIKTQEPFDVIDSFTVFITEQVAKSALVVARSVQPEILYIPSKLNYSQKSSFKKILLLPFRYLLEIPYIFFLLQGWSRANYILCLGSRELEWMKKWFPWWRSKLISYINALSTTDQAELTKIRLHRQKHQGKGIRFLWIGRWISHKGTSKLVDFIVKRAASHPEDIFTIAGCGYDVSKHFPAELTESGKLNIISSFARSQLYFLLANHDVGLFTSNVEGWGLVLNEMLESGMPVFATSAGAVPDLKPLFKDSLQSFPPTLELTLDTIPLSEFKDEYYQIYSWQSVAKSYLQFIYANLCQ
ncbi:glycosyltransferase family 4 protein [Anabaena azotica]|uniref:Glycosyltransferase n=1 Tax=Anabaena azotica FACHB-119 TaxID=947527 RepID=A0ABR8D8Y7_9NOST|nr:glycosyltransferase family 4 protein [Anabaena azotica]MBD2503657.1 glycosyltransferase [Anabaena azotica FACHB-119]